MNIYTLSFNSRQETRMIRQLGTERVMTQTENSIYYNKYNILDRNLTVIFQICQCIYAPLFF